MVDGIDSQHERLTGFYRYVCASAGNHIYGSYSHGVLADIGHILIVVNRKERWLQESDTISIEGYVAVVGNHHILVVAILLALRCGSASKEHFADNETTLSREGIDGDLHACGLVRESDVLLIELELAGTSYTIGGELQSTFYMQVVSAFFYLIECSYKTIGGLLDGIDKGIRYFAFEIRQGDGAGGHFDVLQIKWHLQCQGYRTVDDWGTVVAAARGQIHSERKEHQAPHK